MFGFVKSIKNKVHSKDYVFDHFLRVEYKNEIQAIKKVLKQKLANIYHLRIEYPE